MREQQFPGAQEYFGVDRKAQASGPLLALAHLLVAPDMVRNIPSIQKATIQMLQLARLLAREEEDLLPMPVARAS